MIIHHKTSSAATVFAEDLVVGDVLVSLKRDTSNPRITSIETNAPIRAGRDGSILRGIRVTLAGGMQISMDPRESWLVENPGGRSSPADVMGPSRPPEKSEIGCGICGRSFSVRGLGNKLPRHNFGKTRDVCDGSGMDSGESYELARRMESDRLRYGGVTANFGGSIWSTSTGMVHRNLQCPRVKSRDHLTPVSCQDMSDAGVIAEFGNRACSTCFPDAPSRRRSAATRRSLPRVDTLREESCPVCNTSDSWSGAECSVCGYFRPPEPFLDPDTSVAGDVLKDTPKECDSCGYGGESPEGSGIERFRTDTGPGGGVERFKVSSSSEDPPEKPFWCLLCKQYMDPSTSIGIQRIKMHMKEHRERGDFRAPLRPAAVALPETPSPSAEPCPMCEEGEMRPRQESP